MADNVVKVVIDGQNDSSPAFQAAAAEIDALNAKSEQMAAQMKAAGDQGTVSMTQVRESAALLGEEVGVHIPRGIGTFLAELPGVGEAIQAAFSGVAVIAIAELVVTAGEKLVEFSSKLIAARDNMEQLDEAGKLLTASIVDQGVELEKLQKAYAVIGITASGALKQQLDEVDQQLASVSGRAASLVTDINTIQQAYETSSTTGANNPAIAQLQQIGDAEKAQIATLSQQKLNLQKQYDLAKQAEDEAAGAKAIALAQATGNSKLSSQKTELQAELDLAIAYAQLDAAQQTTTLSQSALLIAAANDAKYQNDLDYETQKLALLQNGKDANAVRDQQAKLEALQTEHLAKETAEYATFLDNLMHLTTTLSDVGEPGLSPEAQNIQDLADAYTNLGITSTAVLQQQVAEAQKDYALIDASGTASLGDILQAQIKVLQAQIAVDASLGGNVAGENAQLKNLQNQYSALSGTVQKESPTIRKLTSSLGSDITQLFTNLTDGSVSASTAFEDFGKSILKTIDEIAAKFIASKILDYISQLFGSFGGVASAGGFQPTDIAPTGAGGVFGTPPGFATGGFMDAGQAGIIGESGPEFWLPDTAGSVIPNNQLGGVGGTHLTQNFDLRGSNGVTLDQVQRLMRVGEERSVARAKIEMREYNLRRV